MASWSENSSYQGAASGAVAGAAFGPQGIAVGAAVGFVAGGLLGGKQEDAARKAEERRLKEIQRAIDRQNTNDFRAKAQAESYSLADIGINKTDRYLDTEGDIGRLNADVMNAEAGLTSAQNPNYGKGLYKKVNQAADRGRLSADIQNRMGILDKARVDLSSAEGILEDYNKEINSAVTKY